jgi:hypothetical protein
MKPFALCWIAGVILVAALSAGCSSGGSKGGSANQLVTGRTPSLSTRFELEKQKHSAEMHR